MNNLLISFFHGSCTLLVWSSLNKKVKIGKGFVATIITLLIYVILAHFSQEELWLILPFFWFGFSCFLFDVKIREVAKSFFVAIICAYVIQISAIGLFHLLTDIQSNTLYFTIIVNVSSLITIMLLNKQFQEKIKSLMANTYSKYIIYTLLGIIIEAVFLWRYRIQIGDNYIPLALTILLINIIANYFLLIKTLEIQIKDEQLKVYEDYIPVISDLVDEVRAQQHDYKNHLSTISMMVCQGSYEELKKYTENLVDYTRFNNKLIALDDKIIGAVIYSKKTEAEKYAIHIKFEIDRQLPDYPLEKYQMVEILNNLLDNAIEANQKEDIQDPRINMKMYTKDNQACIEVANTYNEKIDVIHMFDKGYSTKGDNRGYGLYNIKKIVIDNKGKIEVEKKVLFTLRIVFDI